MPRATESRLLPYSPEQLFDLVADVRRYPEFLPAVSAARVRSETDGELLADLVIGFKGLRETFTSRVVKHRPGELHVEAVQGPLKHLRNDWRFVPEPGGCRVEFAIDFAFRSRILERVAAQVFPLAVRRTIAAFEARAAVLYGAGENASDPGGISRSSALSAA